MKKTLVFLVLLAMLLPSGWINARAGSAWQGETSSVKSTGVRLSSQEGQALAVPPEITNQMSLLYPDAIDPPETCHVPKMAPLGQDLEMMLGPWTGPNALVALNQPSSWDDETDMDSVLASTNLDVIALNTEELVAAWADLTGKVKYATWGADSGWIVHPALSVQSAEGKPALISRGPTHWAVFARFGTTIQVRQWYMGVLGDSWVPLPEVNDASSDPVVVSEDAGHMAVFYRTSVGEVKFTEWEGSWLNEPVSLGQPSDGKASIPIASELSAVSRNDNHSAVFGVDASGGVWYLERTSHNELDWSDTTWIKLLEGAAVEKPAVASRHANHIGVVVKDSTGQPFYTRWSWVEPQKLFLPLVVRPSAGANLAAPEEETILPASVAASGPLGWSQPSQLGEAVVTSTLTLVPRSNDSLSLLGVQSDGNLYEIIWTEDAGWGSWQAIAGPAMLPQQAVTAVMRRMNDIMLLGRYSDNQVWSKNYTSLDNPVTEEILSPALEGLPRGQALAFVEGRWVWVSVTRGISGAWQVEAREISAGVTGYLGLVDHMDSGQAENRLAVAAADLDVDGSAEVVVATLRSNQSDIDLSVLDLSFLNPTTLVISALPRYTWPDPAGGDDVNVAIGDLDGDQQRDEVVVGYRDQVSMRFGVFQYTEYGFGPPGGTTVINNKDWCDGLSGCTVGEDDDHDLEIAIGRVARETTPPLERERLIVLDVSKVITNGLEYAQDWVLTRRLITETWALEPDDDCNILNPGSNSGNASSIAGAPYTAGVGAGDVDADGLANIVYSFGDQLAVIIDTATCDYRSLSGLPDTERSLAMGDIDTDARSEAVVSYRDAATTMNMFEMVEGKALRTSAQRTVNGGHTMLVADTDNDTRLAELAGCKTFEEIKVVAVVNGAPRWYDAGGLPIQSNSGEYSLSVSHEYASEHGTTETYGGSLSLGFEVEINLPIAAVKTGEVRGNVTQEFMGSSGTSVSTVSAQTQVNGYTFEGSSLGIVVYNSTEFKCYYYNVYPPAEPESKTRAMLCTPTGRIAAEKFAPLAWWHGSTFKSEAGPSWVDVGHRSLGGVLTNNLAEPGGNYPSELPVDDARVKYLWTLAPIVVDYAGEEPGYSTFWHIASMTGGEYAESTSFEANTTLSLGLTAWYITVDLAGTYGKSWESSSVTSWGSELGMGGAVEKFIDDSYQDYELVPYVYTGRAKTLAGVVYPYLEMDYYVPSIGRKGGGVAFGLDTLFPYQDQGWKGYFAFP